MLHKPLFLYILVLLLSANITTAQVQPGKLHLYLLIGQSNMAGRGKVEPQDQEIHPRVFVLNKSNEWVPASEPLHFDKPQAGVGPGLSFGKAMAATDSTVTIGLIPCAAGGSSIDAWVKGGYHDQTNSYPYDEAIKRAKIAMQQGVLQGIIWHQGESDSHPGKASHYQQKVVDLVKRLRKELGAKQVPFVAGTLADFYLTKSTEGRQINEALLNLPGAVKNTACIQTADLSHNGDTIHFDTASARELGKRYAQAMQQLQQKNRQK